MARIDRYVFTQLLAVFGFYALILISIYWVNRAVTLLDSLVGDGQSFGVFVQMSLLTIPNIIELITPMAAFAAALFVANRLSNESELVVLQATGFSYFRLARPAVYFGLAVALMTAIVTNFLMPAAATQRRELTIEISRNSTAKYLKEGQFLQPSEGVVLFIRAINDTGELEDLFIADSRDEVEQQIYTAQRAYVVDDNGEPKLLMLDGILQRKAKADDIVSTSRFSDFTYSLANLIDTGQGQKRAMAELSTVELILAAPQTAAQGKWRAPAMQYRGHMRLSWPITAGFTALIGFSALFLGGYSRHGLWWQILIATVLLIGMYLTHILTLSAGPKLQGGAVLAYTTPLLGLAITLWLLWTSGKPRKQNRSRFSPFSRFKTRAS